MPLRIRKENQDSLKASLDKGTPEAIPASAIKTEATPQPAEIATEAVLETSAPLGLSATALKPRKRKTSAGTIIRKRKSRPKTAKPRRKATKATPTPKRATRARQRKPSKALSKLDFTGEIETIRALFDVLTLHASDPEQLLALRSLTEKYLADEPTRQKIDQVRFLLQRQAAQIRREREQGLVAPLKPTIDHVALPAPQSTEASPEPEKLLRGEPALDPETPVEVKSAEATAALQKGIVSQPRRRRVLSWFRRTGGAGGGNGGGDRDGVSAVPFRRKLRIAAMASVWLCIGGVTISYAAALLYVNWARIEIDSAMVSGNIEPVNAPFDGSITSLLVKAGDRLSEGARYLVMEDPEVEKLVKMASVKVERAREDLKLKQAELESEKLKRDEYVGISRNKMEKILSDIDALEKQEKVARERFDRLSDLFKKGFVIRPRVEEASDKLAELTTQLTKARINQKEREDQFKNVMVGHFFDGNQVVGRLKEAEAAQARAAVEVDLALEELQVMQQRRQINRVNASHEARVLKVLRQEGAAVRRGDTMLVVERTDERVIHAFLRQEEITRIAIGDEARVFVPALQAKMTARVVQVDRNAAFLDDVDARYTWKIARDGGVKATDKDRTARVTLKVDPADRIAADQQLDIGMPTVVSFRRRSIKSVFPSFTSIGS